MNNGTNFIQCKDLSNRMLADHSHFKPEGDLFTFINSSFRGSLIYLRKPYFIARELII